MHKAAEAASGLRLTPALKKADGSAYTRGAWTNGSVTACVYAESGASGLADLTYIVDGGSALAYGDYGLFLSITRRQIYGKCRTSIRLARDADEPAVGFDEVMGNGQAESSSAGMSRSGLFHAIKTIK